MAARNCQGEGWIGDDHGRDRGGPAAALRVLAGTDSRRRAAGLEAAAAVDRTRGPRRIATPARSAPCGHSSPSARFPSCRTALLLVTMQLDLFLDGREAILINGLVAELLAGEASAARGLLDRLRDENPAHPDLAALDRLVRSIGGAPGSPGEGVDRLIENLAALVPAANRLLGSGAQTFLAPWWRALARTTTLPSATETAALRRYWIGAALWHDGDERRAVRLWLPLCWLAPAAFESHARALPSRIVREAWDAFDMAPGWAEGAEPIRSVPWFPFWLALRHRWVAHLFQPGEVPDTDAPTRALRLLPRLLVLESQGYGHELVRQRTALRDISPVFFRIYRQLVVERAAPRV
jgi:hypothetical protein